MSKKQQQQCPYNNNLTDEEEDALQWLSQVLGNMMKDCSMAHTRRALVAHTAVGKLLKKTKYLHELIHVQEAELEQAEMMVVGMAGLPRRLGLVTEEDFN